MEDGTESYFQTTKKVLYNEDGSQQGLFCVAKNITSQKQYEFIYEDSQLRAPLKTQAN